MIKKLKYFFVLSIILLNGLEVDALSKFAKISSIPVFQWQKAITFPDCRGYVDDTLALNSMTSFKFWHGQGKIYLSVSKQVKSLNVFINGIRFDTSALINGGNFVLDFSDVAKDGINTIQVSNIMPGNLQKAVNVFIPYPVVATGSIENSGINSKTLDLISDIITSDIEHGFTSAQLSIIRNGRLVYENAWGKTNSYNQNGTPKKDSKNVTVNTLYDLASVSKMFTINYAVQKLVTEGVLDIDKKVVDIMGDGFVNDTMRIDYRNYKLPDINTLKKWKSSIAIKDLLCHQAGFPADAQYHNKNFNAQNLEDDEKAINPLYAGSDGSAATREAGLRAIFKTPLIYKPGSKTLYSDIDYILLCFIIEKITGKNLDVYLRENFWQPLGLTKIAFNPLKNGFKIEDCAATELNGNTFDNNINYPGIRRYTLQGEVHDGKAWYVMGGISGHAGLFSNATDLAKLASIMLTGGYGEYKFFSDNIIDFFTAPKNPKEGNWGLGWWRQGENQRAWYFGTQSDSDTIGHQGWTGTLVMIDPERQLIIAYLTNKINSPVLKPFDKKRKKIFAGNYFTSATLGFVAQLVSIGMDSKNDISEQLAFILADMANESTKLIKQGATHNVTVLNAKSKLSVLRKYAQYSEIKKYLSDIEKNLSKNSSGKKRK